MPQEHNALDTVRTEKLLAERREADRRAYWEQRSKRKTAREKRMPSSVMMCSVCKTTRGTFERRGFGLIHINCPKAYQEKKP